MNIFHTEDCYQTLGGGFLLTGQQLNDSYFTLDQIQVILNHYYKRLGTHVNIRLRVIRVRLSQDNPGYHDPHLGPGEDDLPNTIYVWLHHNGIDWGGPGGLSAHYAGLRPKKKPSPARSAIRSGLFQSYL